MYLITQLFKFCHDSFAAQLLQRQRGHIPVNTTPFKLDYEQELESIWAQAVAKDKTKILDNTDHSTCKCCKHVDMEDDKK